MHVLRTIVCSVAVLSVASVVAAGGSSAQRPQAKPPVKPSPAPAAKRPAVPPAQPVTALPETAKPEPAAAPTPATPLVPQTEILEQILVKVNGDILTKTELEARQLAVLRARRQQLSDDELKKAIAEVTPDILVDAVDEMLILQRGKELGYKLSDEQFQRVLENIRKENKLDTDEAFQAALKQEGMALSDLRKQLERQMIVNQVQQAEVMSKVGVSDEEAQGYYAAHKNEFTTPASITLRELVVDVPGDGKTLNVGLDEAAKAKCEDALARVQAGQPFDKIVAEVSDAPSKANGGLVGPLSKDELNPDIKGLIDPLKVGGVTGVFRTTKGWTILKLESATTPVVLGFAEARDKIAEKVFAEKRRVEVEKYLVKLRLQAIIEWKNEEMRKLYDARLATSSKAAGNVPSGN